MSENQRLRGLFVPNMVPLDCRGEINEAELRRHVDWLIAQGVHGLYPNGSTGEFTRFTADERRRIIEIVVDQTAGRVPILAGAAEANVRETLAACERYHELGVRAVAIVAPFYYNLGPDNVYAYFREIGMNTPIDVTLYNIPMFASPIDVPTVQRLSEDCPRIVAIKDSSGDLTQMMRMIAAVRPNRPDFSFLSGADAQIMPMLLMGVDGGTNACTGIVPRLMRSLYDATLAGRLEEARRLQYAVLPVFDALLHVVDFPEACRTALEVRGFRMGRGRQPLSTETQAKLTELRTTFTRLFAEIDAAHPLVPLAPQAVNADEVSRIVAGVLDALGQRGV